MVDIIIPAYNKTKHLALTLQSIRKNTKYQPYRIITVIDQLKEALDIATTYSDVVLFNQERVGVMNAWNMGARISTADYLCFMMDDFIVPDGWMNNVIKALTVFPELALACNYNERQVKLERAGKEYRANVMTRKKVTIDLNAITGTPGTMRRSTLEKIGLWHDGYDRFGYNDYLRRIRKHKMLAGYVFGTKSLHFHVVCEQCGLPIEVKKKTCNSCGWVYQEKNIIQGFSGNERFDENIPDYSYGDKI